MELEEQNRLLVIEAAYKASEEVGQKKAKKVVKKVREEEFLDDNIYENYEEIAYDPIEPINDEMLI